jgi:hypothetical protein
VIFEGSTDFSGKFTFEGCGKTIRYSLSKSGYRSTHGVENLDSCSCLSESVDDSQTSSTENSVVSSWQRKNRDRAFNLIGSTMTKGEPQPVTNLTLLPARTGSVSSRQERNYIPKVFPLNKRGTIFSNLI